jgi:LacI family transcriptional regulator
MVRTSARLKDIALVTGFSANTVSLALRESRRIPKETRDRIVAAARQLNYLPNHVAQSLVSRETKTIGLVLTDIMNPTLTLAARSIERELASRGYSLMLAATDNVLDKEAAALNVFRSRQVDGMLIYPTAHRQLDRIRPLRDAGYPVVLLVADPDAGIDVVGIDDRRGAQKAVQHLVGLGHRRIAFLDSARPLGNSEKFDGYAAALGEAGLTPDRHLVIDPHGHRATEGYRATGALMGRRKRPTALFAANDSLAIGALRWCADNRVLVPGDLAVVGYDDIEASAYIDVPLTTVHYAADIVSDLAVKRLLLLIAALDRLPDPEVTLIEPELVIRASCGADRSGGRTGDGRVTPAVSPSAEAE